ncbi:hypothetical protein ACJJJB_00420 [Microbulbifer sp. ANSA001]|uniref:hypothetical protein n=1 Tax=Microbulbifer TaxID=48073 RepID=UPI0012FB6543|nr:hypothetical protein [Microbulbifer variabilis]
MEYPRSMQRLLPEKILLIIFIGLLGGCDRDNPTQESSDSSENLNNFTENLDNFPWIINIDNKRAPYIYEANSHEQVLVNVQSVDSVTVSGKDYSSVTAPGIPDYETEITEDLYEWLLSRPRVDTDFVSGNPLLQVGDLIRFGQDIGYRSNSSCGVNAGYDYWPSGPVCPENISHEGYFPLVPEESGEACETGLGVQEYWVNGTSIYQWSDGQVLDGTLHTLAPVAEM